MKFKVDENLPPEVATTLRGGSPFGRCTGVWWTGSVRVSKRAGTSRWNQDAIAGKLDFLFKEVERESEQGLVSDWPPPK